MRESTSRVNRLFLAAGLAWLLAGVPAPTAAQPAASAAAPASPAPLADAAPDPFVPIFNRLYNYDFAAAHAMLDERQRAEPADPLPYSVRAAVYMFSEFERLEILETDFFVDDENMVDGQGHRQKPDPEVKRRLFATLDEARARAGVILASDPNHRRALLAMVMAAGVAADYVGFVERRQWKGMSLTRETNRYAQRLLALKPPVYDAYMNVGSLEYVVGSLPFFIRWFVRFDRIEGDKRKGIEQLKLVAQHGTYYGPFARILLAVASLREKKLEDARQIVAQLAASFPENPLLKRELDKITARIAAQQSKRR
jgi:hypothetical protein